MFSLVNSTFCSDDITNFTLYDIEPHKLRNGSLFRSFQYIIVTVCNSYCTKAGRINRLFQFAFPDVIILTVQRNIILSAEIIYHCKQLEAFWIPFPFIVCANVTAFESINDEIYIAQLLYPVAN